MKSNMIERKIRIAVVSDLHCHPEVLYGNKDGEVNATYLYTDLLRKSDHPIESLIPIIKDETVDLVICPGDLTNKSNKQGFISGWNYVLELKDLLKSDEIIATVGNHDVDSFNNHSSYSFEIAKKIKRNFPLEKNEECETFWSKGCVFVERENYRVLVINSCHFHHNKANSSSGKVDDEIFIYIKEYLEKFEDNKIKIALTHHHPIDHSRFELGEYDKIVNADEFLNVLGDNKFDLLIHGHKHDPLLRYHNTTKTSYRLPIFSSGSFSSISNLEYTSVRNYFHIINLEKSEKAIGEIFSWTYFPKQGWKKNYDENGFAPHTGFGNEKKLQEIVSDVQKIVGDKQFETWENITNNVKEIKNLIPQELEQIHKMFTEVKLKTDEAICNFPQMIFKIK